MGLLRLLLAFSVVIAHSEPLYGFRGMGGEAVQAFFILSGFYMSLVLRTKYSSIPNFYFHRALRLMPLYWASLGLIVLIAMLPATSGFWGRVVYAQQNALNSFDLPINILIVGTDIFRAFGGDHAKLLIPQIWSVGNEIVFYLLAPFFVRLTNRSFYVLLAVAAITTILHTDHSYFGLTWSHLLPTANLFYFLLGMQAQRISSPKVAALIPFVLFFSWGYLFDNPNPDWHGIGESFIRLSLWVGYAAAISALFTLTQRSWIDSSLAELSYPIYLVHGIFAWAASVTFGPKGALVAFSISCAISYLLVILERQIRKLRVENIHRPSVKGVRPVGSSDPNPIQSR